MQVYFIRLSKTSTIDPYKRLFPLLDRNKKETMSNLKMEKDKVRTVLSHLFVKYLLAKELDCKMEDVQFSYSKYKKPYLVSHLNCSFNISHSGDMIAIAIAKEEVGIDCEQYKNLDYVELAKQFCVPEEYSYIIQSTNVEEAFYKMWTLKESYVKAIGKGLHVSLKSFSFSIDGTSIYFYQGGNKSSAYHFYSEKIQDNYHFALCSRVPMKQEQINFHSYDQSEVNDMLLEGVGNSYSCYSQSTHEF
ncbi:4'-phosphopantetheinyl transferase superfamily protein [Siminovitchia sp. FSL H7-0308]|uniref:4'-phosphopantetheinyl transferase n=1 Tax=Siminovitchia thermophila TaxID=1245522 RepID=A0ABS2RAA6_9BACI|nr:4'-phosphopantetheinyl transferase superfamily protein [Siminovitchia thermophila]MBM7716591.1 4'-phosphopantetheinyl transferase [Siminovitchia thermophila]ONK24711.1 hypothetical protein BLX87_03785 [Bacillus sp. VT-16-64]